MPDETRAYGGRVIPPEPPAHSWYRRRFTWTWLVELWANRPLISSLVRREFQARYRQTRLGLVWAVLTPGLLLVVFTFVFNRVTNVSDASDADYAVSTYLGLLPWTFFATSLSRGGQSLVLEAASVNKVRAPREVFPLSFVVIGVVDLVIAVGLLPILFVVSGTTPEPQTAWVPLALVVQLAFTTGAVLVVSAVIVFIRDIGQALPLVVQMGLFATPVAYPIDLDRHWELVYGAVNPLVGVIDTYRRCVLAGLAPDWPLLGVAAASAAVLVVGGYVVFKRLEPEMADVG